MTRAYTKKHMKKREAYAKAYGWNFKKSLRKKMQRRKS